MLRLAITSDAVYLFAFKIPDTGQIVPEIDRIRAEGGNFTKNVGERRPG